MFLNCEETHDHFHVTTRGSSASPVQTLLSQPSLLSPIHAQPSSAKTLLSLAESGRRNPKILAMLAQRDLVFLARLLCLAASSEYSEGEMASTASEAIAIIGLKHSFTAMTALVNVSQKDPGVPDFGSRTYQVNQFVISRCMAHWMTSQRLSNYLGLSKHQASMLQLSSLLDSLGLLLATNSQVPAAAEIQNELLARVGNSNFILRDSTVLPDYALLSTQLARQWGAPKTIISALSSSKDAMHALVIAVERMVDAKLHKKLEQMALASAVADHSIWVSRLRKDEIALAVLPW